MYSRCVLQINTLFVREFPGALRLRHPTQSYVLTGDNCVRFPGARWTSFQKLGEVCTGEIIMSDEFYYRLAREDDFPTIKGFYGYLNKYYQQTGYLLPTPENVSQLWMDSFVRTLGRFSNLIVVEVKDQVIGFILSRIKRSPPYMGGVLVGELSDMWVVEEYRRSGVGKQLIVLGLEWVKEQKVHSVEVQIPVGINASWKICESLGFVMDYRHGRLIF